MGSLWRFFQFGTVVTDFCQAADADLWDAMEDRLHILAEYGNSARMPVSENIAPGLFALRANADNLQGRLLYFFGQERRSIVFVESILLKKTRRIPPEKIVEAQHRKRLVEFEQEDIHEFTIN